MLLATVTFVRELRAEIEPLRLDEWHARRGPLIEEIMERFDVDAIEEEAHEDTTVDARIRVCCRRAIRKLTARDPSLAERASLRRQHPNFGRF